MTAGQGGQYGNPEGGQGDGGRGGPEQGPQGWNAPPPAQGWGGYGPAPAAPQGYGPPPPGSAERPVTVRAGIGAFVATVVLGLVATLVMYANLDTIREEAIAQAGAGLSGSERETAEEIAELVVQFSLVIGLLFTAVYVLFLWFAWRGRNWARIVLWVLGGFSVLSGLTGLASGGTGVGYVDGLNLFSLLLTLAGIVLLALKPSNEWYRHMGWLRSTGQSR